LVIGVGNRLRRDDGLGLEVAERLAELLSENVTMTVVEEECYCLLDLWQSADTVYLVDAVRGPVPGTVHRIDAAAEPLPSELFNTSTHSFGVAGAVELARALRRLPRRLFIYGIAGRDFSAGEGLSPEVRAACTHVVDDVRRSVLNADK
jgi:hydrogenase maturation protease